MKNIKSHFWYTKSQRNGILFLLFLIILFQIVYFSIESNPNDTIDIDSKEFLAIQQELDSLKVKALTNKQPKFFPFNPNFITDYKGYKIGMSTSEIDRLHTFRAEGRFVNSSEEFQKITKVSDSLLAKIAPFFKFPDWVNKRFKKVQNSRFGKKNQKTNSEDLITTTNINSATSKDFETIEGVNEQLSKRIIKYRSKLKGFIVDDQLNEVWGINKNTVTKILKVFNVKQSPEIVKVNVNTATFKEILKIPYIDYELCKQIFEYRDEVAELQNISELRNIKDFPQNKYDRIILYLKAE